MSISAFSVPQLSNSLKLYGKSFKHLGDVTYERWKKYHVIIYWVPNNAIGKCIENDGQGSYTVQRLSNPDREIVNFVCSVPIVNKWELGKQLKLKVVSHINGYQWRLEDLTDDDEYKKFDFYGNLRRQQQEVLLNFTKNPIVGNYYQGVTEYYPEEHRDILFARVEFNCSSQEENFSFCTENNLRNLAKTLTTVGNGELVQTLGKIY